MLNNQQISQFLEFGFLKLERFYDLDSEIYPILIAVYKIVDLIIDEHNLDIVQPDFSPENFDTGYSELVQIDRKFGGIVYDAIKQIPGFLRLVSCSKNEDLLKQLRRSDCIGIAAGSYGIRIDNPNEDKHLTHWHQEYPTHLRSVDGIVLWSPLVEITEDLGPVKLLKKSHKLGVANLEILNSDLGATGNNYQELAKNLSIANRDQIIENHECVTPLSIPGDLFIFDYRTIHSSSRNISNRSRWTMQFRYFNFEEKTGKSNNWIGGIASGNSIFDVHPELIVSDSSHDSK